MSFKIKTLFASPLNYGKGLLVLLPDFMHVQCNIVDGVWRGAKLLNVKKIVDDAVDICTKS